MSASRLIVLAVAIGLFAAPAAQAANRYASPDGTGSEPCAQSSPCSIQNAIGGASSGDEVTLLGGVPPAAPYTVGSNLQIQSGVTVQGAPGARPLVQGAFSGNSLFFVNPDATLRDVDAVHSDANNTAVFTRGTVERVAARSDGGGCVADPGALVRDSVCWSTGNTRGGFTAQGPYEGTVSLRNVTAVGTGGTTPGLGAHAFAADATLTVAATNVIAFSAGGPDITGSGSPCCTGEVININLDHSNFDTVDESDTSSTVAITDPGFGTNVATPPVFADLGSGDFSQDETSVGTINLGVAGLVNGVDLGSSDLDGRVRNQGGSPDIGADELPAPPAPTGLTFSPPSGTENNPKLSGFSLGATSYDVYPNATCTPPAVAAGVDPALFEGEGVVVSVPDGTTSAFSVTATGPGGPSVCSAPISYTETTSNPKPGPGITGERARALLKCKKLKGKSKQAKRKKKRCIKRARGLPV